MENCPFFMKISIFTAFLSNESIMAKKQQAVEVKTRTTSTRKNRVSIMLNDEEMRALHRLISTYKIKNKSKFIRETLMTTILRKFDEDHPTLF